MMMMDNYRFKHLASGWPMAMAEITGKARINFYSLAAAKVQGHLLP